MKKHLFSVAAMAVGSLLMMSCSSSDIEEDLEPKSIVDLYSESQTIQLTQAQQVFVNDNNTFTLNFLKAVNETDHSGKSFIYSPLSITYVLGMVNDAATGQTEQELEQALGFHQGGINAVNDYCKNLIDNLPKVDNKVTLNIANAIFLNKNYTLKPQFTQDMQTYYNAKAEALDFGAPETLDHINGWAKEKTNGMIPNILDEIDPYMVSYLLNAIYFKADWASKFDKNNTKTESFTTDNGKTELPLMHQNVLINYVNNGVYSAIKMPYGNGYWDMTVMLPEDGKTTDDIISQLSSRGFNDVEGFCGTMGGVFKPYEVDLKLPRYETESDTKDVPTGLTGLLQKMGINRIFDGSLAEIPNMANAHVYISMMRQKAKIKVNEEGSEAAAITVAGITATYINEPVQYPKAVFHANRPFVYVIREASSGVILFVGKFTGK
ncbi:MAG: serpin family protein [Prevotella sp.]|jgi:serpin B|nr:serpin family protein [Prevotella sp.]